jgi:hypothetical protein
MFRWAVIEHRQEAGNITHSFSLLDINDGKAEFLASISLYPTPDYKYEFCAWNKDRTTLFEAKPPAHSVRAAQGQIIVRLKHIKVLPMNYRIPEDELYVEEVYPVGGA